MEYGVIVGIATGSVAFASLIVLSIIFLMRRRRCHSINRSTGTQMFFVPPTIKVVSEEDLESQQDPPVQQVSIHRPQMGYSPTTKSIKPTTRNRSMSFESHIVSPLSPTSTVANPASLSRTSTITNNNHNSPGSRAKYHSHAPSALCELEATEVPTLPASLIPGSSATPPLSGWLPPSPTTLEVPSRKVSPLSVSSQSASSSRRLSPVQYPPPAREVSPLPAMPEMRQLSPLPHAPRPTIIRRSTTDATNVHSLYSIAEAPPLYTPRPRYYSADNTVRESLVHIPDTQNALPELPGCQPVVRKHTSWHTLRG